MPLFRKEAQSDNQQNLFELEAKLEVTKHEIENTHFDMKKKVAELNKTIEEIKKTEQKNELISDELNKMKAHMDPTSLTLKEV